MLKIAKEPHFAHVVAVRVPVDGGYREETVKVTYRVLAAEKIAAFRLGDAKGATAFLREAIVKLDDLAGEDGKPLTYNDALRDEVIAIPYVRAALAQGYFDAVGGAREGN